MGTYLVMINKFKRSFHHKILFVMTLLLPVTLCIAMGLVDFGKTSIRVGILLPEESRTDSANELIASANELIDVSTDESANAGALVDSGSLYEILDQSDGIKYGTAMESSLNTDLMMGKFHVVLDYRDSNSMKEFELLTYQKEEKAARLNMIFQQTIANRVPVQLSGIKAQGLSVTERNLALLLSMFLVLSTVHASMIIRDKQSGTLLRYQFAKKSKIGYVAGYTLQTLLITFVQILLCIVVLMAVQKEFQLSWIGVLSVSVVMSGIVTIFCMIICLGSRSEMQSNITASSLAALLSLLGGTFVAVEAMPGLLRVLSYASPIRWLVELVRMF